MKMKKAAALAMLLAMLCTGASAAEGGGMGSGDDTPPQEHKHRICGAQECPTGHAHAADVEYTDLNQAIGGGSALTGTKYYLSQDYKGALQFNSSDTVYLCLNGHKITADRDEDAVYANGNLVLCDCKGSGVITHQEGKTGGGVHGGGAVTIYGGTISGNNAQGNGGGVHGGGDVTIYGSTISENSAAYGGGVHGGGDVTIYGGTISENSAAYGGGVYAVGNVTIHNGTISENSVSKDGGGVYADGAVTIYGGTISKNRANSMNVIGGGGG